MSSGPSLLAVSALATGAATSVRVDLGRSVGHAPGGMACVNLDWWPSSKCDYGRCPWRDAGLPFVDLEHPSLVAAVDALGAASPPLTLRVGGSLADIVSYNVSAGDGARCGEYALDNTSHLGYALKGPCLSMERWEQLHRLCAPPRCRVAFGLNGLAGRRLALPCPAATDCKWTQPPPKCCTSWVGAWDPTNALELMRYSRRAGLRPFAFELGNEIAGPHGIEAKDISAARYAADLETLRRAIGEVFGEGDDAPKVVAYDSAYDDAYVRALLGATDAIDILTTHAYELGPGAQSDLVYKAATTTPALDATRAEYAATARAVEDHGRAAGRPVAWVGEAGGAYNSGAPTVTDAFASAFWYLDAMGSAAAQGFGGWCRQTLVGGNYSLLSTDGFVPHPDFYAALLWRSLMGPTALAVGNVTDPSLRAYAHCSAGGALAGGGTSVSMLLLNLGAQATDVDVGAGPSATWLRNLPRDEWIGTASGAGPRASAVLINGERARGVALPPPRRARAGERLTLPPLSYAFVRASGVDAPACRE